MSRGRKGWAVSIAGAALCAAVSGVGAESIASSAIGAGSASVGSLSDSSIGSSDASSPARPVAEGRYRIVEVAELAARPDRLRLTLQPAQGQAGGSPVRLDLPRETWVASGLSRGDLIAARQRPYGLAILRADATQPFFLLLSEPWRDELEPRAVTL